MCVEADTTRATTHAHVRLGVWLALTASAAIALACKPAAEPPVDQPAPPSNSPTAQYLANAAVLVTNGGTKVVFDPLFRNDFGTYERVPEPMERALFAGDPPFDGLDAVFVSHYHEDHFSAVDVLRLLEARPELRLYAPAQAVAGMRQIASGRVDAVMARVNAVALQDPDVSRVPPARHAPRRSRSHSAFRLAGPAAAGGKHRVSSHPRCGDDRSPSQRRRRQ